MDVNEILYIYSCRPIQLFVDFICNFLSTLSNIRVPLSRNLIQVKLEFLTINKRMNQVFRKDFKKKLSLKSSI